MLCKSDKPSIIIIIIIIKVWLRLWCNSNYMKKCKACVTDFLLGKAGIALLLSLLLFCYCLQACAFSVRTSDPSYGSQLWIPAMDPSCGFMIRIIYTDPSYGSQLWIPVMDPSCGSYVPSLALLLLHAHLLRPTLLHEDVVFSPTGAFECAHLPHSHHGIYGTVCCWGPRI